MWKDQKSLLIALGSLVLVICVSCSHLKKTQPTGIDLCHTDIIPFALTAGEATILEENTLRNMSMVNCSLHEFCGIPIPYEEMCEED